MNKLGKIYDFKTTINDMHSYFNYVNKSNQKDLIYPTLYCIGTVKVCGTQMCVVESNHQRHYQSKNKIITVNDDNYDCAKFCEEHKYNFDSIFNKIYKNYGYDEDLAYCIFMEYFGKNISGHNTAISNIDRKAMIFDVRVFDNQQNLIYSTIDNILMSGDYDCEPILSKLYGNDIFNTYMFKTYELMLDLKNPEETADKINNILQSIENECPVGKFFNKIGICEGIVWSTRLYDKLFTFKTKTRTYLEGDKSRKNKKPKEKLIVQYEPEVIEKVETFVNEAITFDRLEQAKNHINKSEFNDVRDLGKVIKFMINDILEEERLTIAHNNFSKDLLCKCIAEQVKKLFNIQN